jgi:hypothetical protein
LPEAFALLEAVRVCLRLGASVSRCLGVSAACPVSHYQDAMACFFDSIRAMHEEAVGSYYATTDVPVSTVPVSSVGVPSSGGAALPLHHASLKRFVQGTRSGPSRNSPPSSSPLYLGTVSLRRRRPQTRPFPELSSPPARPRSFRPTAVNYRAVGNAREALARTTPRVKVTMTCGPVRPFGAVAAWNRTTCARHRRINHVSRIPAISSPLPEHCLRRLRARRPASRRSSPQLLRQSTCRRSP